MEMEHYKKSTIYLPPSVRQNLQRKHRDKKDWIDIYFYQKRKIFPVKPHQIVATSVQPYKKKVFYRCSQLCNNDPVFDYYKILKPHPCKKIGIKRKTIQKYTKYKNYDEFCMKNQKDDGKPYTIVFE